MNTKRYILCCLLSASVLLPSTGTEIETGASDNSGFRGAKSSQQRAVSGLIRSLKEVQKVIMDAKGKSKPSKKEKDPFHDKQKYKKLKMDPEENPERQLEGMIKEQEKILDELKDDSSAEANAESNEGGDSRKKGKEDRSSSSGPQAKDESKGEQQGDEKSKSEPGSGEGKGSSPESPTAGGNGQQAATSKPSFSELQNKQQKITDALNKLARKEGLNEGVKKGAHDAAQSSHATESALGSNSREASLVAGHKTKSDLKWALSELRRFAGENFEQTLRAAQMDLNEGKHAMADKNERAAYENARAAGDKLAKGAWKQNQAGSQQHAERLARLAEKIRKNNRSINQEGTRGGKNEGDGKGGSELSAKKFVKLRNEVARNRMQNKSDLEMLNDAKARLDAAMEIIQKARMEESPNAEKMAEQMKELELAAQDVVMSVAFASTPSVVKQAKVAYNQFYRAYRRARRLSAGPTSPINTLLNPEFGSELLKVAGQLSVLARQVLESLKVAGFVRQFNLDDVPEAYRKDVPLYFEKLSDAQKGK